MGYNVLLDDNWTGFDGPAMDQQDTRHAHLCSEKSSHLPGFRTRSFGQGADLPGPRRQEDIVLVAYRLGNSCDCFLFFEAVFPKAVGKRYSAFNKESNKTDHPPKLTS